MTNPAGINDRSPASPPRPDPGARRGILRPVLWAVLLISAAANMVASASGLNVLVGAGFGVLTLGSIIALVIDHRAHLDA